MLASKFPIVTIGASAGGLAALKSFFESMPVDSGAAFVVIQHLDPKHESLTADILARSTSMPTKQISEGMKIEANHIYVIPPNAYLTLTKNIFHLSEAILQHGLRLPIDAFLWSLAKQYEERAIAIIVSGTGSDGTLGLRALKESGGLVLAQEPNTAEYDGMPRSAISTGLVDIICPIQEMPKHLMGYLHHPYIIEHTDNKSASYRIENQTKELNAIIAVLHTRTGHDFKAYKKGTLERRISRRMGLHHLTTMAEYVVFLRSNEDEANLLFKDLLIGVTEFFRDPDAFVALKEKVIVPLLAHKENEQPIRIWVPGCASGEEAYSIAMTLIEHLEEVHKNCPIQIFASDIDETALSVARRGIYPENIAVSISPERLQRFFFKQGHSYHVNKFLRDTVTFATQNLISDPPFSNLDLISCRNLLIYLSADIQGKILSLFHFALKDNGCLFLGHSETSSQQESLFEPVSKKWRIYKRIVTASMPNITFPTSSRPIRSIPDVAVKKNQVADSLRLNEIAQQHLLQEFAPAAVLVNAKRQIVSFSGATARYLEQPSGSPSHDLLILAKHELRAKLRIALRRIAAEKKRIVIDDVLIKRDTSQVHVKISLRPINVPQLSDTLTLITFEDILKTPLSSDKKEALQSPDDISLLQQMEDELHITREDLQSNIEELESSNEELQAANEEVMSVNEELQSSNEELESSKEELQSMNEELTTVNNQYKEKVEELSKTNDDLDNLLTSTDIATLFIDSELKIGRFTPATQGLLNLISTDVGRPLSNIRSNLTDNHLLKDVQKVLAKLSPIEGEINTKDGHCYLRRIVPYRTNDNRICGVVITFIDITERIRAEEDNLRLATVIRDSNDAVTLLDPDGKIISWNHGAQEMYGWSEQEALTKNIRDLVPKEEQEKTLKLLQSFQKREVIHSVETQRVAKDGSILDVLLTVTPLFGKAGEVIAIATTERNISERKLAENNLRNSEANFRALVESAPDALVIVNSAGKIEVANSEAENLFGYSKYELIGMKVEALMPSRYAANHATKRKQYFTHPKVRVVGNDLKLFALNKKGEEIPIEVSLSPIETNHGRVVSAAIRDIRQRQRTDEALRTAKLQAEHALATKSRFLATASHDLRQPIHSLTLLNKALSKSIDQPEAQKMLAMQGESLAGMARLLNSLLDISKLESSNVAVHKSNVDLSLKLAKLCDEFAAEADAKGLQISFETDPEVFVFTDRDLLAQLLRNLLANAIRYTKQGFVKLSAKVDNDHINIAVSDSGIGIPEELLSDIFEEFHQVNRDPQQRHGGLGLGLSIVQRIANLLGSRIEVFSELGKGSTFSIRLSRCESKPQAVIDNNTGSSEAIITNAVILLIDDDPDVLDATHMLLSLEQGFKIIAASSPPEAYKVLNKLTPDLIISDFHLNHKDTGASIIHKAKTPDGRPVPAILVSGDTSTEMDKINSANLVVMNKPVDPEKLISVARELLRNSALDDSV